VFLGPFRGWDEFSAGVLTRLESTLSEGSGDVKWSVLAADSPEAVTQATATSLAYGTYTVHSTGGRQYTERPQIYGASFIIKLEPATAKRRWGIDRIVGSRRYAGEQRL
jgi:hypothetical protein